MNEVNILRNQKTISSCDIAEIIGKKHKDTLKNIRDEKENILGDSNLSDSRKLVLLTSIEESSKVDSQNEKQPCYIIGEEFLQYLADCYEAGVREKLMVAFCKIESQCPKEKVLEDFLKIC